MAKKKKMKKRKALKSNVHPAQILSWVGLGPSHSSKVSKTGTEVEGRGIKVTLPERKGVPYPQPGQSSAVSWKCRGVRKHR